MSFISDVMVSKSCGFFPESFILATCILSLLYLFVNREHLKLTLCSFGNSRNNFLFRLDYFKTDPGCDCLAHVADGELCEFWEVRVLLYDERLCRSDLDFCSVTGLDEVRMLLHDRARPGIDFRDYLCDCACDRRSVAVEHRSVSFCHHGRMIQNDYLRVKLLYDCRRIVRMTHYVSSFYLFLADAADVEPDVV